MPDPDFRITVRSAEGGTSIELDGELDVATAAQLEGRSDEIINDGGDVWMDCSDLTFADSTGLATLTRLATALRDRERRLVLTDVRPVVRQAMDVLRITDLFELDESDS